MTYPALRPTSRTFDPGNWSTRTYNAQNGAEVRILYGSQRYNLKLALTYSNLSDSEAEQFLQHYNEMLGTYKVFTFEPAARVALFAGWQGTLGALDPPLGVDWRYAEAPRIDSVRPGVSTVTVSLVGVI